jgi:tRNA pseudouridine55 synthase
MTTPEPEGVLPIDKPVGPTSHDAVARARRSLRIRRIGHTGTLDPFASGLLLLCVGSATRIAEYLTVLPKTYTAVMRLGEATDTDDHTGTTLATSDAWRELDAAAVAAALRKHLGPQLQVPPAYSARKVGGERLYERARRGESAVAEASAVMIHDLRLTGWEPPFAQFETTCSSGTYVRAIARDVGRDLGTGAHLSELRRTAIGDWRVETAVPLAELDSVDAGDVLQPTLRALAHLPQAQLDGGGLADVGHGRAVPVELPDAPVVVLAYQGALAALARVEAGRAYPRKVFAHG